MCINNWLRAPWNQCPAILTRDVSPGQPFTVVHWNVPKTKQNKNKEENDETCKYHHLLLLFFSLLYDQRWTGHKRPQKGTTGSLLFAPFVYTNREEEEERKMAYTHTLIYATKRGNPEGGPGRRRREKGFVWTTTNHLSPTPFSFFLLFIIVVYEIFKKKNFKILKKVEHQ